MHFSSVAAFAVLAGSAAARHCINATVPVTISARQATFDNWKTPTTNLDATTFQLNVTQQGRNFTAAALSGYHTQAGTYNISTQFCMPTTFNYTNPTVQVLTHGIGFDKTYWDLSYNNYNYSYVNYATDISGYCTLSYDRLGIGNSSHGDALNEIQLNLEVQALRALTMMLRQGTFPNVNHAFKKVVHVGHSFGSAQTYTLASMYPNITDAIVLTGFTMNSSFAGYFVAGGAYEIAALNQPLRFGNESTTDITNFLQTYAAPLASYLAPIDLTTLPKSQMLPPGYLITSVPGAINYQFFKPNAFDPAILQLAEATKQPVTPGEALTLFSVPMNNSFTGPVFAISGDADLPYCGGNCTLTGTSAPSLNAEVVNNFPSAANFTAYTQPNTGHGLNLHYNSTAGYMVIQDYLLGKGLVST